MYQPDFELGKDKHKAIERDMQNSRRSEAQGSVSDLDVRQMHSDLRRWTISSLVIGALSVFVGGTFDPVWGVVMIVIAILAWQIKLPAMFVLYGVLMAWAAVMNGLGVLMGGSAIWMALSFLQVYWAYSIFKRWKKYNDLELGELYESGEWPPEIDPPQDEGTVASRFGIAGLILSLLALVLLPAMFVVAVVLVAVTGEGVSPGWMVWLIEGSVDMGVMGLGLSLAGMLSGNERRGWAIGGTVTSALVLVVWLVLLMLPWLG